VSILKGNEKFNKSKKKKIVDVGCKLNVEVLKIRKRMIRIFQIKLGCFQQIA
jgi:hypothetical protein